MNCMYATMGKSNITACVNNLFTFFRSAYYTSFLFSTNGLSQIFAWIAPDNVYLYFSLILVTKAIPVEQGTTSAARLSPMKSTYTCD